MDGAQAYYPYPAAGAEFTPRRVGRRSTLAQRNDLMAYVKNYLANASVIPAAISNFESVY